MRAKFDTCFFERYAMFSLATILGDKYANLVNYDRPDLQDIEQGLGIEVTRAIMENKATAQSLINEMGAGIDDVDDDDLLSMEQYGYTYGLQSGRYVGRLEVDYWSLALPLKRIIQSKVRKVADGFYGDFREFGLYIFSKDTLTPDEMELTMNYTIDLQRNGDRAYKELFVSQIQQMYACNLKDRTIREFSIPLAQRRQFYMNAIGL